MSFDRKEQVVSERATYDRIENALHLEVRLNTVHLTTYCHGREISPAYILRRAELLNWAASKVAVLKRDGFDGFVAAGGAAAFVREWLAVDEPVRSLATAIMADPTPSSPESGAADFSPSAPNIETADTPPPAPPKQPRGRPRKTNSPQVTSAKRRAESDAGRGMRRGATATRLSSSRLAGSALLSTPPTWPLAKRRPGRPRKQPAPVPRPTPQNGSPRRGRGRPPKNPPPTSPLADTPMPQAAEVRRGRGRPPKLSPRAWPPSKISPEQRSPEPHGSITVSPAAADKGARYRSPEKAAAVAPMLAPVRPSQLARASSEPSGAHKSPLRVRANGAPDAPPPTVPENSPAAWSGGANPAGVETDRLAALLASIKSAACAGWDQASSAASQDETDGPRDLRAHAAQLPASSPASWAHLV